MSNITNKVLNLLTEEGISPINMRDSLLEVMRNIEFELWESIRISTPLLYNLKDTIWYNMEHLVSGGSQKGKCDLRYLGSKFPTLMFNTNDYYIVKENVQPLLLELESIRQQWSSNLSFVQLYTKSNEGFNGGKEDPSPVIIYDPNIESPTKYGYTSTPSYIYDDNGDEIPFREIVLCSIEMKLGTYDREPLMKQLLDLLIETCKKAIANNKGIAINSEEFLFNQ